MACRDATHLTLLRDNLMEGVTMDKDEFEVNNAYDFFRTNAKQMLISIYKQPTEMPKLR
jgi:hypothetical protein